MADGLFLNPQQALAAEAQMRQQQAMATGVSPLGAQAQELGRTIAGAFGGAVGAPMQESPDVKLARARSQAVQGLDPTDPNSFMSAAQQLYQAGDYEGATQLLNQGRSLVPEAPDFGVKELKVTDESGKDVYENWITQNGMPVALFNSGNRRAKGTEIKNIIGGEDFYSSLNKELGKDFVKQHQDAEDAARSIRESQEAINLLNSGIITGTGATFLLNVGKALKQVGIYEGEAMQNTEAYFAAQAKQVAQIIKAFGAGTGLSDADREFAQKAAAGKEAMTEESMRKIIDINNRASTNALKVYNAKARRIDKDRIPFDLTIDVPVAETAFTPKIDINEAEQTATNPTTGQKIYGIKGKWYDENGNEVK